MFDVLCLVSRIRGYSASVDSQFTEVLLILVLKDEILLFVTFVPLICLPTDT